MTDNNVKPITDKPITVRIPLDLLENIEAKASERYPSRKGIGGNRSQVILDALVFYQSHQWGEDKDSLQSTHGTQEAIEDEVKKLLSDNVHDVIQETVHKQLQSITDHLEYLIDKALEKRLQSTQSNNTVKIIQSVQSNTNEDKKILQSTQDNTEKESSEDSLEGGLNDNQVLEDISDTTPLETPLSENKPDTTKGVIPEPSDIERIGGFTGTELGKLLGLTRQTISNWKNRKQKGVTSPPSEENAEAWEKFLEYTFDQETKKYYKNF